MGEEIKSCKLRFRCSMKWSDLALTDLNGVRHCTKCDENVALCKTDELTATDFLKDNLLTDCVTPPRRRSLLRQNLRPRYLERSRRRRRSRIRLTPTN
jgi:hypothetical protein